MRTHYKNGEKIRLSSGCDGCNPLMVNGILCHEHGCSHAWKDKQRACFECGMKFYPENRCVIKCPDCNVE